MVACCRVGGTEGSSICMGSSKEDPSYSLVAQMVKHLPARQETRVGSLGWEDPLEKEMVTYSSIFAWKIP